jgi:hypothetical protein
LQDPVSDRILKMTLPDLLDRRRIPRRMKTCVQTPRSLCERELHLVPVPEDLGRGLDGKEVEPLEPPDAGQAIGDLPLLVRDLRLVGEAHPVASPTGTEMGTTRRPTLRGWIEDLEPFGLGEAAVTCPDARADDVPRHGAGHEHDESVDPCDAGAAVRKITDRQLQYVACTEA